METQTKMEIRQSMKQGVPSGYNHNWTYKGHWQEHKKRKGLWTFTFTATKHRHAKKWGTFGKGTTGAWRINGIQYIKIS